MDEINENLKWINSQLLKGYRFNDLLSILFETPLKKDDNLKFLGSNKLRESDFLFTNNLNVLDKKPLTTLPANANKHIDNYISENAGDQASVEFTRVLRIYESFSVNFQYSNLSMHDSEFALESDIHFAKISIVSVCFPHIYGHMFSIS